MRNSTRILIFFILFFCLVPPKGQTCTTFCLDHGDQPVFGRNYDWMVGDGLVIVNKRGVTKAAWSRPHETANRLTWTSKYGSATFNQHGREFPMGGINEAGLVVETMMLEETEYPSPDSRPGIEILQWIQYQLDNFSTIEEVIESHSQIRIRQSGVPGCHFLVCDRTGNSTTIEFIGGRLVYHTKERMPVKTLTNSTYAESISFWKKDNIPQPDKGQSVKRFIRAANMVKNYDPKAIKTPIDFAFDILESVAHDSYTQWSIVYDVKDLSVYFRTLDNQRTRYFDLKSFDLSCEKPVRVLDINTTLSGDITDKFIDYTYQINRNIVGEAFRKTPVISAEPVYVLDMRSKYPETTSCIE